MTVSTADRHRLVIRYRSDEPPPAWAAIAEFYDRQILYCPKTTVIVSVHECDDVASLLLAAGRSPLLEEGTTTVWALETTA